MSDRKVLVLAHTGRPAALSVAEELLGRLSAACNAVAEIADPGDPLDHAELVIVLGGDGTILRGAEHSRGTGVPLLGVNLGHVGFLAESERDDLAPTVERIASQTYEVEERMTLAVTVRQEGEKPYPCWALNEVSVEKASRERMLELTIEVDGRPLSSWGGDGLIVSTPTGSTAYAFSAGGPVVWPQVEAMLLVPNSAHALFARPLVLGPDSHVAIELGTGTDVIGIMWCDGRRHIDLPPGARIEVRRGIRPVRLARLTTAPFTDRLVAKFRLPVRGWRGDGSRARPPAGASPRSDRWIRSQPSGTSPASSPARRRPAASDALEQTRADDVDGTQGMHGTDGARP